MLDNMQAHFGFLFASIIDALYLHSFLIFTAAVVYQFHSG